MTIEHSIPNRGTGNTREERGIELYKERGREITVYLDGTYSVPSATEEGVSYAVDLRNNSCSCKDHEFRGVTCQHIYCCEIWAAKHRGRDPFGVPVSALPTGGVLDFVPFSVETLDGVWTDGLTALVHEKGCFFVCDFPLTGDDAGGRFVLDAGRDYGRMARSFEEITGCEVCDPLREGRAA